MNRTEPKRTLIVGAVAARVTLALAALAIGGCASRPPAGDRSAISDTTGSVLYGTFLTQGEAQLQPESKLSSIFTLGDGLYAYTENNKVYALSQGLDIRFLSQIIGRYETLRPAVPVGEEVIFPTSLGLVVTDKAGTPRRTVRLEHPLTSNVSVDQRGRLVAGVAASTGGRVVVLDPQRTVRPEQQRTLIGNVTAAPVSLQGTIFAATDQGRIYAVGAENFAAWGLQGSSFDTGRPVKADLAIDDFALYVAGGDGVLYALDQTTGRIKWRYMAELALTQSPLVTKDRVYQVVPDVGLVALDKLEGQLYREPLWTAPDVTQVVSTDDKYVYAVRGKGTLVALGLADGKERFSATGRFDYVTAGADNAIFAATADGAVVKLKRGPYAGEAMAGK